MMKVKSDVIEIEVPDWYEEHQTEEPTIKSEADLIALAQKMSSVKVGRLAIMSRHLGLSPTNIIPGNKLILQAGSAYQISALIASQKTKAQLPNGNEINVREFVAPVRDDDQNLNDNQKANVTPSPEFFTPVISEVSRDRALDYLLKRVPGYVMGRLEVIAVNGGDVKAAAVELKARIDEMVLKLT